jgi:hypothetical protein
MEPAEHTEKDFRRIAASDAFFAIKSIFIRLRLRSTARWIDFRYYVAARLQLLG